MLDMNTMRKFIPKSFESKFCWYVFIKTNITAGLLEKPKFQEAEESCNFSGNCSPVVNSNLQNHFQSPFSIEEALYNMLELVYGFCNTNVRCSII